MSKFAFKQTALASGIAACLGAAPLQAQMLEEVIVTATKRAVGMQDVPIALAVMEGEKINEQGVRSLTDVAIFMPNAPSTSPRTSLSTINPPTAFEFDSARFPTFGNTSLMSVVDFNPS